MSKRAGIFCAALFLCGTVIVPALHQTELCGPKTDRSVAADPGSDHAHGHEAPVSGDSHDDSDNCPICQLAVTPTIRSCSAIQIVIPRLAAAPLPFTNTRTPSRLDSGTFRARAPPFLPSI